MTPLAYRPCLLVLFFAFVVLGCTSSVASSLEERDANLIVDVLQRNGIDASKEPDPGSEAHYRIVVARDDSARAIATMHEHDLPPRHVPGVAESVGKGAILPSPLAEHAQFIAGTAGDLERTLGSVDGVLGARVHLSVPFVSSLTERPNERSSAAILVKHLGKSSPLTETDVKRLVAGSVANLSPDDVTVVMVSRSSNEFSLPRTMATIGPITVAQTSMIWLRLVLGVSVSLLSVLALVVLYQWNRLRRFSMAHENQEHA